MKSLIINRGCIILMLCFCLTGKQISAQFSDALVPDNTAILMPLFAQNTGNFVLDIAGTSYAVSVWDDYNGPFAAMEWRIGALNGYVLIDAISQVMDPDVCLIKNTSGSIFAVVAYFDLNSSLF